MPIYKLSYFCGGQHHFINVYPTLQFLYSHHIQADYITNEIRRLVGSKESEEAYYKRFFAAVEAVDKDDKQAHQSYKSMQVGQTELGVEVLINQV